MSFLFGGRPQLSSEQKIAAAEAEIDMVSDMYSRYALLSLPGATQHVPNRYSHMASFIAATVSLVISARGTTSTLTSRPNMIRPQS
jgi:hypothetical protein